MIILQVFPWRRFLCHFSRAKFRLNSKCRIVNGYKRNKMSLEMQAFVSDPKVKDNRINKRLTRAHVSQSGL